MDTIDQRTATIRALNDRLRTEGKGGRIMLAGDLAYNDDAALVQRVCESVRDFVDFNEDNDPHGEHDFGAFEIDGEAFNFKISYYDLDLGWHSPDAADPAVTARVLSIFYARDY